MTTPTTPDQARCAALNLDFDVYVSDVPGMLLSLAQQVEALTADLAAEKLFSKQAMDSVTEIAAQRDALKPDAERYRHLRDAENEGDYSIGEATDFCDGGWERVTWRYGADLDASIDSAMKAAS